MDTSSLIGLLFSGGTALAGLILVFLGGVLIAYDSYDEPEKAAVRMKYKRRARVALSGFIFALASAVSAFVATWYNPPLWVSTAVGCLAVSFLLTLVAAVQAVGDIS